MGSLADSAGAINEQDEIRKVKENAQVTSEEYESGPDFSDLPDVVWVQVLKKLSLSDRASVAATCHALNEAFNHPSLWHTVTVILRGTSKPVSLWYLDERGVNTGLLTVEYKYLQLIKRFGSFFQNLSLLIQGYFNKVPPHVNEIVSELSARCRLETLTLQVGSIRTALENDGGLARSGRPKEEDLRVILSLLNNSYRLREFQLLSWPSCNPNKYPGLDIIQSLCENEKLKQLEKLNLFYDECKWSTVNAHLPSAERMVTTVQHFTYLSHLSLRLCMMSDELVKGLSKSGRTPLSNLKILVTYSRHNPALAIPEIYSSSWSQLSQHSPELEVEITFLTRMPYVEKAALLKPEIPLTGLAFMTYSNCTSQDILGITDKYSKTLKKLVNFSFGEFFDEELITLVSCSSRMDSLVHLGEIYSNTIVQLAQLKQWKVFEFKANMIKFEDPSLQDEDVVVGQRENGELYLTSLERKPCLEEDRLDSLASLREEVSRLLGYCWHPQVPDAEEQEPSYGYFHALENNALFV
ncbi:uncharacterized protein LOC106165847 [Lingula anatina]|uniref:Uncharacterized protein LOC106165847 n=1 Tax=Lingula anatina TaxID=7574 RepID=A0A1S3IQ51_LINAN|nr:uncharacterized protein LOC106165847 [Lingula anatina]|eukprot:XP_013399664.1 uncharacterized protein LOC106165847 [Lingula anatina]